MTIRLTDEEMQLLNIALGLATGAAMRLKMNKLARSIVRLCDAVNRDNPNYTPYGDPAQKNANPESH